MYIYSKHLISQWNHIIINENLLYIIFYSFTEVPDIILAPQSQNVKSGTTLILECDADGEPIPQISWKRNGTKILVKSNPISTDRISFLNENTELKIEHIKESDAGKFWYYIIET